MTEEKNPTGSASPTAAERHGFYVSIWEKTVDTQMHFNEMSVRARQFGLAFVAAALGLGVVLLSRGQEASIDLPGGLRLHATVLIALASAMAMYAVKLLDLNVYHKMLRGAVAFGEDFEQTYLREIFHLEKGMTQAISHFSRFKDGAVTIKGDKYHYTGTKKLNASSKIGYFYTFSIASLLSLALGLFLCTSGIIQISSVSVTPSPVPHTDKPV